MTDQGPERHQAPRAPVRGHALAARRLGRWWASGRARWATCIGLAVSALIMSAFSACAGESSPPPKNPPGGGAVRKAEQIQVSVTGTGIHVWILLVVDAQTRDVQTDWKLPYRRDVESHFGVKVEARNGSQDRGSITCEFKDARGVTIGEPQTKSGGSALVRCIHDTTRA